MRVRLLGCGRSEYRELNEQEVELLDGVAEHSSRQWHGETQAVAVTEVLFRKSLDLLAVLQEVDPKDEPGLERLPLLTLRASLSEPGQNIAERHEIHGHQRRSEVGAEA